MLFYLDKYYITYLWSSNMSSLSPNPLSKHFRQPQIYIKLPSEGRWYPDDCIDIPVSGEIPIYAMTARDEITMKTPDALLNGTSTVHVIESCCPSIKDAWKIPSVDLDAILLAIRLATYGKEMEFNTSCPHCSTVNEKAIDISIMIGKIAPADYSQRVKTQGLEIELKPQNYEDYNKNNMLNFQEQRILQLVQNEDLSDDQKTMQFNDMFQRLIETGINQVGKSIAAIYTEDSIRVDKAEYIHEFLNNCDRSVWEAIKTELDSIKNNITHNQVNIVCSNEECQKDFTTPFVFEQTNFFG
jgi:hypothetical protein